MIMNRDYLADAEVARAAVLKDWAKNRWNWRTAVENLESVERSVLDSLPPSEEESRCASDIRALFLEARFTFLTSVWNDDEPDGALVEAAYQGQCELGFSSLLREATATVLMARYWLGKAKPGEALGILDALMPRLKDRAVEKERAYGPWLRNAEECKTEAEALLDSSVGEG